MEQLITRIVIVFLMAVYANHSAKAQYITGERPCWLYHTFETWHASNDTVYGQGGEDWTFYLLTGQSVTINGREYTPLVSEQPMYTTTSRQVVPSSTERSYTIGIRREDGRVYADFEEYSGYLNYKDTHEPPYNYLCSFGNSACFPYHVTDDGEVVLYDYTLQEGDIYAQADGVGDICVSAASEVTLADGQSRRRLELSNGLVLIEGIGCINSTGLLLDYLNPSDTRTDFFSYLEWYSDGTSEFKTDVIVKKDNGTKGISDVENMGRTYSHTTYDLTSRRFQGQPRKGVYISGGKKLVK